jgi:voltage-gated potassium channel
MERKNGAYLLFMLILSTLALIALAIEAIFHVDQSARDILSYADFFICILFFGDFLISLFQAKNKQKYFLTWGWLDLLSSIPTVDVLRWGRLARIARIFRVLRGFRSARVLAIFILKRRAQSVFLAVTLLSIMLVTVSAISVLHLEAGTESNIKTPEDAIWWAVTTITTVGYGDKYPVTSEGRVVATILMAGGVGLFGTFSGFIASWFLTPAQTQRESELAAIRQELAELKILLFNGGCSRISPGGTEANH